MAGSAINSVAFPAAGQYFQPSVRSIRLERQIAGKIVAINVSMLAGQVVTVWIKLLLVHDHSFLAFLRGIVGAVCRVAGNRARNRAGNGIAGRSAVGIELAGAQRNKLGLVM